MGRGSGRDGGGGDKRRGGLSRFNKLALLSIAWMLMCVLGFSGVYAYRQMSRRARLRSSGSGSLGATMAQLAHKEHTEKNPPPAGGNATSGAGGRLGEWEKEKAVLMKRITDLEAHKGGGGESGEVEGKSLKKEGGEQGVSGAGEDDKGGGSEGEGEEGGQREEGGKETDGSSTTPAPAGGGAPGGGGGWRLAQKGKKERLVKKAFKHGPNGELIEINPADQLSLTEIKLMMKSNKKKEEMTKRELWKLEKLQKRAWIIQKGMNYDPDVFWLAANWTGDLLNRSKYFHRHPYDDGFDMENSNCSRSFNRSLAPKPHQLVLPERNLTIGPPSIHILTLGMGTTATRTLFDNWCHRGWRSLHYAKFCNIKRSDQQHKFIIWFRAAHQPNKWKRINITNVINEITSVAGVETIVDAPVPHFSPRFVSQLPDAKIIFTLRPAHSWAASRMKNHGWDWICHPKLWDKVAHPFDFERCMKHTMGIVDVHRFCTVDTLAEAYQRYNEWVLAVVPPRRMLRVCFWDCAPGNDCSPEGKAQWFQDKQEEFLDA